MYRVVSVEMANFKEKCFHNILEAQKYVKDHVPGQIWFVPVAAFGIAYTAYRDDKAETYNEFTMADQVAEIRYTN
jgi:hypothetical protein